MDRYMEILSSLLLAFLAGWVSYLLVKKYMSDRAAAGLKQWQRSIVESRDATLHGKRMKGSQNGGTNHQVGCTFVDRVVFWSIPPLQQEKLRPLIHDEDANGFWIPDSAFVSYVVPAISAWGGRQGEHTITWKY